MLRKNRWIALAIIGAIALTAGILICANFGVEIMAFLAGCANRN